MTKMQNQVSTVSPVRRQSFIRFPRRTAAAVLSPVAALQLSRRLLNAAVRHCAFMPWAADPPLTAGSLRAIILARRRPPDFIVRHAPIGRQSLATELGLDELYPTSSVIN